MNLLQHLISPDEAPPFPEVSHGRGIYIWDREGHRYLDGSSGAVASNIGHDNPRVKAAMAAQADQISFAYARVWENTAHRQLSAKLIESSGLGFDSVFLVSGGTEAIEASIKLARQSRYVQGQTERWRVISRTPSYHGSTLSMLGVTGDPDFAQPFRPLFVDMPKVPAPMSYRTPAGETAQNYADSCAEALRAEIERVGAETVLAFIMEPVGGTSSGALVAPASYYRQVREICDRYGILLIFDEVMCGAGRTGKFLAAHHWPDCVPDIVALAKGVSGGYAPLGAVLARSDLVRGLRTSGGFLHGHTYAANPQSCAAGSAVLDEIRDNDLVENAATMGDLLKSRLLALQARSSVIGDVRGLGLLLAVEIVANRATKAMFGVELQAMTRIQTLCREEGLMLLARRTSGGRYGEWLMVCPPLTIGPAQVEELVSSLERALLRFEAEIGVAAGRSAPAGAP